jgi:hypothetical protein
MSTVVASILWRLVGPTGHLSECQLWQLPTGEFQLRLVHDHEPEAIERFNDSDAATARATVIANRYVERGWRQASV